MGKRFYCCWPLLWPLLCLAVRGGGRSANMVVHIIIKDRIKEQVSISLHGKIWVCICTLLNPLYPQFRHPCSSSKGCLHCTRTRSPARTHAAKRSIWVIKVMYYPPKWATQLEKGNKKPSIQQFPAKQNIFIISSSHDGKRDNFDFLPSTYVKVAQWKNGSRKKRHSTANLNFFFCQSLFNF